MAREEELINLVFKTLPRGGRTQIVSAQDKKNLSKNLLDSLSQSRLCYITEPKKLEDKEDLLSFLMTELKAHNKSVTILAANKIIGSHYNEPKHSENLSIWQKLKNIAEGDVAKSIHSFLFHYENELKLPLNNIFSKSGQEVFIVDDAYRLSFKVVQKLLSLTEKRQANVIFLKNQQGRKSLFSGNPLEIIEQIGINQIDCSKIYPNKIITKTKITIEATKIFSDKQSERQIQSAKYIAKQLSDSAASVLTVTSSKKSAEKLNLLIRDELIAMNKIDRNQHTILVSESIYLTQSAQKYAASYPKNAFIKEYIGKGQHAIRKIMGHDVEKNQVIIQGHFGRSSTILTSKISNQMKSGKIQIYREKELGVATGDIIRLTNGSKQSDFLGLKMGKSYKISEMDEKYIYLNNYSENSKNFRIKKDRLNGLSLSYGYARSIHEPIAEKNIKQIICDLPSKAITKVIVADLSRHTDHLHIITDSSQNILKNIKDLNHPVSIQKNINNDNVNTAIFDIQKIETQLKQNAAVMTEKMLGPPNEILSNQNEWHYGIRGDLVVYVQGKKQGSFHHKMTGEVGGMTELLAKAMNVKTQDALSYAAQMIKQLPSTEIPAQTKNIQSAELSHYEIARDREIA